VERQFEASDSLREIRSGGQVANLLRNSSLPDGSQVEGCFQPLFRNYPDHRSELNEAKSRKPISSPKGIHNAPAPGLDRGCRWKS